MLDVPVFKKANQIVQRYFNCKLSSWTRGGVAKQGTRMVCLYQFILCTLLISFERSGKLSNKIPYQLIMLPFLCPVTKWHFNNEEQNKQYPETYLDKIQEWIEYLSTRYVLCRFDNHWFNIHRCVHNMGFSRRKPVQYCGLPTRPFASSPDFCYNKWGL